MKTLLLLCSSLVLAPSTFSQKNASQAAVPQPVEAPTASCPVQVDEAWLAAQGSTIPADTAAKDWSLHVSLTNKSEKAITSFTVHAELAVHPGGSLTKPVPSDQHRKWTGDLAPMDHLTEDWKLPTGPHTAGLNRIWFDRIHFADGSSWTGDGNATCSFAPTGHMVPAGQNH